MTTLPSVGALFALTTLACGCATTPVHLASGRVEAESNEFQKIHATDGRCERSRGGANEPVRLTFKNEATNRDTVIEIPNEATPTHVDVTVARVNVTLTRRVCSEFEAHVRTQTLDGTDGTFASGTLRLSCTLPAHDGSVDVNVDFDQC